MVQIAAAVYLFLILAHLISETGKVNDKCKK